MKRAALYKGPKGYEFLSPYDQGFIDALKWEFRGESWFDYDLRVWYVDSVDIEAFLTVGKRYYRVLDGRNAVQAPPRPRQTTSGGSPDYAIFHLTPNAPIAVVSAVYRQLAKDNHPDSGGSHEKMAAINAAYDRIKSGTPATSYTQPSGQNPWEEDFAQDIRRRRATDYERDFYEQAKRTDEELRRRAREASQRGGPGYRRPEPGPAKEPEYDDTEWTDEDIDEATRDDQDDDLFG